MRDLVLMIIIGGCVPLSVIRPHWGILVYVWIGLMNPHRFVYRLRDAPVSLAIAVATILGMVLMRRVGKLPMRAETGLIFLWFCYVTMTSLFALAGEPWQEWDRFSKILLMTIVAGMMLQNRAGLTALVFVIMASIGFFGLKGGLFSILTRGHYLVWGPEGSFIAGNNELALAELMIMPLILYFVRQERIGWRKLAYQIWFFLTGVSVVFSYSRGALVALAGLTLTLVWRSKRRFFALALVIVLAGTAVIFAPPQWMERMHTIKEYKADASAMGRVNAWNFAFNLALRRFIGGGFGAFNPELFAQFAPNPNDFHDAHSIYFEVLGEQGFPGLSIFLGIMIAAWLRMHRVRKLARARAEWKWAQDMAEMLQASITAYAMAGAFLGLAYFDLYYYIVMAGVLLDIVFTAERSGGTVATPVAAATLSSGLGRPATAPARP